MMVPATCTDRKSRWLWRAVATLLILVSGILHICYLARDCPLDLAPDEAHYWQWSQNLDASYYSKGPAVAYLIRGSCELFGDWSRRHCGSLLFAVRLPAVVCGTLFLVSLYILTLRCFQSDRLAAGVVGLALTIPAIAVSQSVMTIDAPYLCCWGWALVVAQRAVFRQSRWAWPALGLLVGVGILAKYTMVLFFPALFLFLVVAAERRDHLKRPGFWLAGIIALLCCLPIAWWNFQNDWVSFRHVGGQAGVADSSTGHAVLWLGPLKYVGGQIGVLFGFWFVLWAAAMIVLRPGRAQNPTQQFLWWMSAPIFLLFAVFSFRTNILLNWPVTAYISGLVLAAGWAADQLGQARRQRRLMFGVTFASWAVLGILAALFIHDTAMARPVLAALVGPPTAANPLPLRRVDPTCRMRGWSSLARQIDVTRMRLQTEGCEPVVAASRWTLASELAFYCADRPVVYSLGSALWDRQSQFDLWRPNPIRDPGEFLGRTFIFVDVGQVPPEIRAAFEHVEPTQTVRYEEDGQPIAFWDVTICRGFRGFPASPQKHY